MFGLCDKTNDFLKTYYEARNNDKETSENSSSDQEHFERNRRNVEYALRDEIFEGFDPEDF